MAKKCCAALNCIQDKKWNQINLNCLNGFECFVGFCFGTEKNLSKIYYLIASLDKHWFVF